MVKRVNKAFASLDAEAIKTAVRIYHVTTISAKIHVKVISVDRMHCARLKIMQPNVNVQPVSRDFHSQNKDVFGYRQRVFRQAAARMDTCALEIFAKCHALIQFHVQSVKDVIIAFVQRFATQTTIVCQAKSVTSAEHANRAAQLNLTVLRHKFAKEENVNVVAVSSEHHSVALTLMNVRTKYVTIVQSARIQRDHSNAFAQNKLLATHTQHRVACFQINAFKMKIALRIWLVSKGNAQNHARSPNVDAMQFANRTNIKHSVSAHRDILEIQPINLMVASVSSVSAVRNVVTINTVIHKSTNVKVSTFQSILFLSCFIELTNAETIHFCNLNYSLTIFISQL